MKRGGQTYNIGGVNGLVGIELSKLMANGQRVEGSGWFTAGEGQQIMSMASTGALDLSVLEHVRYPLDNVNEALSGLTHRNGGFTNFVVIP
ncbi:MAG TPA: alcohol dehydrogenase, partial [Dongiaceae bacterium]|nr:alcohol dehydrogenase [Dongiaceae bacterium]